MKRIVLTFGLLSGLILSTLMAITLPLCLSGKIDTSKSYILGYTTMVLAFLLVFFGIRSYRQNNGGTITFGKAFQVGILITLVTCAFYIVTWEIMYFGFFPDFEEKYAAMSIERLQKSGASDQEILKETQDMERFKRLYKNPLVNVGMTFMEVFPVGLVVTLVSAAILRRRTPSQPAAAAA
jgi:uncharacterized protein DUF4199